MKLSINLLLSDMEKDFIGKSGFFNGSTVNEEEGKKTKMEKRKKEKTEIDGGMMEAYIWYCSKNLQFVFKT